MHVTFILGRRKYVGTKKLLNPTRREAEKSSKWKKLRKEFKKEIENNLGKKLKLKEKFEKMFEK